MNDAELIRSTETLHDGVLLALGGEIDLSNSPTLRTHLLEAAKKQHARLIIEMSEVTYMDSSGVATLVEVLQIQRKTGRLILCGLQPKVRSIFEIARLNTVFVIVHDRETAVKA